jgi:hypothetical protein
MELNIKTLVCFRTEEDTTFFSVPKDLSHLHNEFIGLVSDEGTEQEITETFFKEDGKYLYEELKNPIAIGSNFHDFVIITGVI